MNPNQFRGWTVTSAPYVNCLMLFCGNIEPAGKSRDRGRRRACPRLPSAGVEYRARWHLPGDRDSEGDGGLELDDVLVGLLVQIGCGVLQDVGACHERRVP